MANKTESKKEDNKKTDSTKEKNNKKSNNIKEKDSKKTNAQKEKNSKKTSNTKEKDNKKINNVENVEKESSKKGKDTDKKKETKRKKEKNIKDEKNVVQKEKSVKLEEIKQSLKNDNKLPKEEDQKINKSIFKNIIIAILIIIYFIFLNLGKVNIKAEVYQTDLKVFSICTLLIAIILIENAYKKDSGEIALYGIEMIAVSIVTLSLIYINLILSNRYVYIVNSISCIFAIYYLIKAIVLYIRKRKKYFVDDMKEMMDKEEE